MRLHRLLRTIPLTWWVAALGLAALTGSLTTRALRSADAAVARWGDTAAVMVVLEPVAAGQAVTDTDVARRSVPRALLPRGALADRPGGRVALVDLVAGEILLEQRLAGGGRHGPAALLGPDERAVAITATTGERPRLAANDLVDLVGVPADGSAPSVLARRARVLDVDDQTGAVTVAVPRAAVIGVAQALERGRVVVALAG